VLLIFQPAEEKIGGAKKLIENGLFKDHPVDAIYGVHLYPEIDEGIITTRPGTMMASPNELTIRFKGKSSHGAMPHLGIDANHMASLYLTLVYEKINQLNQEETVICTFGKIEGGSAKNIIAESTYLEGTMRTFNHKAFIKVKNILESVAQTIEQKFKGFVDVMIHDGYLPVINDDTLYQTFVRNLEDIPFKVLETPLLIGEDFSFYQEKVPGLFFFVGVRNEAKGYTHSLHSSSFNFDEKALEIGVLAYKKIIHSWMI
jgi:N-acetyldiaminopimelate deacetylase